MIFTRRFNCNFACCFSFIFSKKCTNYVTFINLYLFPSQERQALRLEKDKEVVVRAADREMKEANVELEKSRIELENMDLMVAQVL